MQGETTRPKPNHVGKRKDLVARKEIRWQNKTDKRDRKTKRKDNPLVKKTHLNVYHGIRIIPMLQ